MAGGWGTQYYDPINQLFSGSTTLPWPDTDPFSPAVRTNAEFVRTIGGTIHALYPEVRYSENPITFTWTRQSGASLVQTLRDYVKSGTGLRIFAPYGEAISGAFTEVIPRMRPGYGSGSGLHRAHQQIWDIQATFQPYNLHSGG